MEKTRNPNEEWLNYILKAKISYYYQTEINYGTFLRNILDHLLFFLKVESFIIFLSLNHLLYNHN